VDLQAFRFKANTLKHLFCPLNSSARPYVAAFVMTIAQAASYDHYTVGAIREGIEQVLNVCLPGAGQAHDLDVGWIFLPQRSCGIASHISAVNAGEERNFGGESLVFAHSCSLGRKVSAPWGQVVTHLPQPVHDHGLTMGMRSPGTEISPLKLHAGRQIRQPSQSSSLR